MHSPEPDSTLNMMVNEIEAETADSASEVRAWSDLAPDLLALIMGHLTLADRCCCARVCTVWFSVFRAIPPYNGLSYGFPCLASISEDDGTCTLVDPFSREVRIKCQNLPLNCFMLYSKGGWLLMLSREAKDSIFFFNPLTDRRIDLPDINFPYMNAFAFSSPPTSPDCLVLAIRPFCEDRVPMMHICRRGDKEWTDLGERDNEYSFCMNYVSPVFFQGSFYCLGDNGRLGVYDPSRDVWRVIRNPRPRQNLRTKGKQLYLVEYEGELLMVYTDKFGDCIQIYKLDPLTSRWKDIDSLGDASLFVGWASSSSSMATVLKGNGIYFPRIKDGVFMFYSCKERRLHPGGNFCGSSVFPLSFWIEPVWFQPSSEEQLKWSP